MTRNLSQNFYSKMTPGLLAAVMAFCLFCVMGNPAWAASESQLVFEAEGKSSVKNENYVRGRALAVDYAFQNAMEMALQETLGSRTFKRKRKALDKMLKRPKKFIKRYRFLEYYDSEVEQFSRVKLEVVFYPQAINRELSQLGILSSLVKPNTALILVSEKSLSADVPPDFWEYVPIAEVAMLQKFLAAGVNVTPRQKISEMVDESVVFEAIQGDLDAAVDIGLKARVDIVIVGTAVTTRLGEKKPEGPITVQANLTLRAVSTTQSTVIAARSDFASVEVEAEAEAEAEAEKEKEFKGELEAFEVVGKKMAVFFLDAMKRFWEPKPEPLPQAGIEPDGSVPKEDPGLIEPSPPPPDSTPSIMEDL